MRRYRTAGLALALAAAAIAGAGHAASFDARRAADIAALVASHGASGTLKKGTDGKAYFDGQVGNIYFDAHFQTCNEDRSACKTVLLGASWDSKKPTADQINRWNRWTLFCPAYLDKDNTPNIWYAIAVSGNTSADDLVSPLSTWMDCLHDFDTFVDSPEDFLKNHG
jgi:hypothetical protein